MGWESFTVPDYFESAISVSEARLLSGRRRGLRVEIRAEDGRVFTLPGALLRGVAHPRDVVAALVSEREATLTHLADADFEGPVPVRAIQVGSIRTTASDGVEYDRGSRSILISGLFITLALALVYLVGWRNPVFGEMLERASARNR
jgi:hypothetical protein